MDEFAKVDRSGPELRLILPEGIAVDGDALRVRRKGRSIVLEPVDPAGESPGVAPGSYTLESLPPLSAGAAAILASVDTVAPLATPPEAARAKAAPAPLALDDAPRPAVRLTDEPRRGVTMDE